MLRVWTLIAMYSAFARGQPIRYALIEMAALTLMLMLVPLLSPLSRLYGQLRDHGGRDGLRMAAGWFPRYKGA
jgi:hypothetical protein